jgi:hypothetical protein
MLNPGHVRKSWCPTFVDYLHLSVNTAMAFSTTDVSAIKPWAKLTMMAEEMISVAVGILVVVRAVNILRQHRPRSSSGRPLDAPSASPEPAPPAVVLPSGAPGDDHVVPAGYHRWPGEVVEQRACDDPGMDKTMVCAGVLAPHDQKASPRGRREATATGKRSR